jgi:hypothetical protein
LGAGAGWTTTGAAGWATTTGAVVLGPHSKLALLTPLVSVMILAGPGVELYWLQKVVAFCAAFSSSSSPL